MQSEWNAYGLGTPADNMVMADVYVAYSCLVTLNAFPQLHTVVHLPFLPVETAAVRLWSPLEIIWYAIDAVPGPIPDPVLSATVPDDAFVRGDILKPAQEQICALPPGTGMAHTLQMVSRTPYAEVWVTALTYIS